MNYSRPTKLKTPLSPLRTFFDRGMTALALGLTLFGVLPLISVLWNIISKGLPGLTATMFTKSIIEDGFANAIVGTLIMVAIGAVLSIPIGVATGIYLAEYAPTSKINRTIRFLTTILTGVPSIVVGIFTYDVIVLVSKQLFDFSYSAIAGGVSLAIIMLPIIALTTEEVLKLVPTAFRLAAFGLGATRFQTIARIILPSALPAISTGILLALARASGETAPLLFTALFAQDWAENLQSPTGSLPVLIFNLYNDPDPVKNQLVWTASLFLLGIVLAINLPTKLLSMSRR
ncbi:phosphate ABC transporter permease PstA [Chamaesiphon sp. OTE_75_metabat_556]|jgi:phosphate transport system permease protein|uniref:phosphate ABC transporter permease PstA n=1 Tax=Chamaesiphon sp. OTE_75_metabat_556 TaxID=2964692 RepID=UPI00286CADCB|nr:phosphate ABC transporter permease PstA [Chamaesiphon sp. OTE_75_metabat_556]